MRRVALALVFALAAGACAGPLDEPVDHTGGSALRADGDLPSCAGIDLSGGTVSVSSYDDGFIATAGGEPLCWGSAEELVAAGVPADDLAHARAFDGTPLPAYTDGKKDGTPLPP